jgi:hypothetical protein
LVAAEALAEQFGEPMQQAEALVQLAAVEGTSSRHTSLPVGRIRRRPN